MLSRCCHRRWQRDNVSVDVTRVVHNNVSTRHDSDCVTCLLCEWHAHSTKSHQVALHGSQHKLHS